MGASSKQIEAQAAPDFTVAGWRVQPRLGCICRGAVVHHLEPKVMQVLVCLSTSGGDLVLKDELLRAVWPDTFVSEHALTHAVWQLRRILVGEEGQALIGTVPKRGYRLLAPVQPCATLIRSIAVLPFANLSRDPEQDYFADGLTESLITDLAQLSALRVISRTSSMQYKSTSKSARQIASELNVDALIEGSVLRSELRVRVSVQLINGATDEHLWANSYDGSLGDVLGLQAQIARAVVDEIKITLTPQEHVRLTRPRNVNAAAHDAYLKGRFEWYRLTEPNLRASIAFMQDALLVDPNYALAWTGLGDAYCTLASPVSEAIPPAIAAETIQRSASRALDLDPTLADAHHLQAWLKLYYEWDWAGAEQFLRHTLTLNPNSSIAYATLGVLCSALERHGEATAAFDHACELDPLSMFWQTLKGWALVLAGDAPRALDRLKSTLARDPEFWFAHEVKGIALLNIGRFDEAIKALTAAVRLTDGNMPRGLLGVAFGVSGQKNQALAVLSELQGLSTTRHVAPILRAWILASVGETDRAIEWLNIAFEQRDPSLIWLKSTLWKPLQDDSRYWALVRRLKFQGTSG